MNSILSELYNKQLVWSADYANKAVDNTPISTGFDELDAQLSSGFPSAGLIHIDSVLGCGEMRLMLSIIQQQNQHCAQQSELEPNDSHALFVFINPPFRLSAEFLLQHNITLSQVLMISCEHTQALWSAEQCLKSGACRSVFMWPKQLRYKQIQKLELAAIQGNTYGIWFNTQTTSHKRNEQSSTYNLPLSLSLSVERHEEQLRISIRKQKRGWAHKSVKVPLAFVKRTKISPYDRWQSHHKKVRSLHTHKHLHGHHS